MEAEYMALSSSLKTLLPLRRLILEILEETASTTLDQTAICTTVFEDNQSAYYLATNQRITNRTKFLLIKWHWFWDMYNKGEFTIVKCPTTEQAADYLTKPLSNNLFRQNRKMVQGW